MSRLSYVVHQLCRRKGMMLKELAEKMRISPVTLSQNLAKDKPKNHTFKKIAEGLGVEVDELKQFYYLPRKDVDYGLAAKSKEDELLDSFFLTHMTNSYAIKKSQPAPENLEFIPESLETPMITLSGRIRIEENEKTYHLTFKSLTEIKAGVDLLLSMKGMNDAQKNTLLQLLVKVYKD